MSFSNMSFANHLFRESSLTKVAAVFDSGMQARDAAVQLQRESHIQRNQIHMIGPFDEDWGRKLEPKGLGVWRAAMRTHRSCAAVGLGAGLFTFAALMLSGVTAVTASPLLSLIALLAFGTMFGLLAGGLPNTRPDHDAVIDPVRTAKQHGRWSIVVHPLSPTQRDEALRVLAHTDANVSQTSM
ncbi:MAG: riboflavin biosynthesis protein RibA [Burkholderiales bacterium]|nr:riboflavin biosynthesis protein RibA [Burkholderiales bacterium]